MQISELFSLIKNKQFKKAISGLENFLIQSPNHLDGLNLLGVAYNQSGEFGRAKAAFEKAVKIHPNHLQSRLNLALCQIQLNEIANAKVSLLACKKIQGNHPDVLNALGNIYRIEGHLTDAETLLKKAYALAPQNPSIFENLAWLALRKGENSQAENNFAKLNHAFPNNMSVKLGLSESLIKQEKLTKAKHIVSNIFQQDPQNADAHLLLALIYRKLQQYEKRLDHLLRAIKYKPTLVAAHFQLGLIYQEIGNEKLSAEYFETVIKLRPTWFEAYFHLAYKGYDTLLNEEKIDHLVQLCRQHEKNPELYWLYFTLAKAEEKRLNYQQAFQYYKAARLNFSRYATDNKTAKRPFDELKQTAKTLAKAQSTTPQFIFITGMPRSGTTLTDQILDCHSQVHSIGESGIVAQLALLVEQKTKSPYYLGIEQLSDQEKLNLITQVLAERQLTSYTTLVDSTPNNVFYVSFILSLIPNSKIIFCKRSPLDNCLSIYQYPLAQQSYSNDLTTLGKFYLANINLIEHWENKYPNKTKAHIYEQVIDDPEQTINDLLAWLNLSFESACLTPQDNKRHVLTPSSEQVRKPINDKAIGKWQKFAPYITELTAILYEHEKIYQQKR